MARWQFGQGSAMSHEREHLPPLREVTKLLWVHADHTAERVIHRLGGPLRLSNLERFLRDRQCLRYATSLHFEEALPEGCHFGEPVLHGEGSECHCCLNLHARYQDSPGAVLYLVAYMAAAITYGDNADPELCEHLGARLIDEPRDAFCARIGKLAQMA